MADKVSHAQNTQSSRSFFVAIAITTAVAFLFPFFVGDYYAYQATIIINLMIALLGLNLLTGYNGQVSLGHGAFLALGGYMMTILSVHSGLPYWLILPLAAVAGLVVGMLFGFPALRLQASYLALATLALAMAVPQLLKHGSIESWTGGVQGLQMERSPAPFGISDDKWFYLLSLSIGIISYIVARNLTRNRIGRALSAIRDNPIAAASMGVDISRYKIITFGISAMFAALSGALAALASQFTAPDSYSLGLSILLYVGIIVGGLGVLPGAIIGAIFLHFVPHLADAITKGAPGAIFGALMIASVFFFPRGLAGVFAKLLAVGRSKNIKEP